MKRKVAEEDGKSCSYDLVERALEWLGQVKHWSKEWQIKKRNLKTEDQLGQIRLNLTSLCKRLKGNN